jgi:thiamine pyrophosphate-dependent acetolactate synthase large subunit-like protein
MLRSEAIDTLVAQRGDAITIATEQAIGAWRKAVPVPPIEMVDHIEVVGCMGSASTLGLGIALAQPGRRVIVMDGDGSLLMQLGSLVTIAGCAPANLVHILFENGVYETSGSQPLPGEGRFDMEQMAKAAGYAQTARFESGAAFGEALPGLLERTGPTFISLQIQPEDGFLNRSGGAPMGEQMHALRERLMRAGRV